MSEPIIEDNQPNYEQSWEFALARMVSDHHMVPVDSMNKTFYDNLYSIEKNKKVYPNFELEGDVFDLMVKVGKKHSEFNICDDTLRLLVPPFDHTFIRVKRELRADNLRKNNVPTICIFYDHLISIVKQEWGIQV